MSKSDQTAGAAVRTKEEAGPMSTPPGLATGPRPKSLTRGFMRAAASRAYLLAGLAVVIAIGAALSPFFLTSRNFSNVVVTGSVISILAVGQFMVIVTAGIDLSVGSVAALASVIAAVLLKHGWPMPLVVVVTLACCALAGVINGSLVVFGRITPFISTLAMLSIAEGVAFLIQHGTLIVITRQSFINFFAGSHFGVQSPVLIFVVITIIFAVIMRWTVFGRQLYAIGGNTQAARLSGLPVRRNLLAAYTISGVLAGLAGLVLAAQLSEGNSLLASGYELNAIAAAVVGGASLFGGVGSPITAVLGGLLIGVISDIMNLRSIQAQPQLIIQGTLIVVAVYFTSGGGGDLGPRLRMLAIGRRRTRDGAGPGADAAGSASPVGVLTVGPATAPPSSGPSSGRPERAGPAG